jgi:hypothetical protein
MANSLKMTRERFKKIFPNWYAILYAAACGFLIPWTILLAVILPHHYNSRHWDIAWVGFDIFECLLFAITAILAIKHSLWTALTSSMLGTALLIDAWFDVLTASTLRAERTAIIEAFIVELPIAILSYGLSYRVINYIKIKNSD